MSDLRGVLQAQMDNRRTVVLYADAIPGEIQNLVAAHERAINVGIAESTLVSVAAGLASTGHRTIVFGLAPFLASHAYASLRQDVSLDALGVTFVGFAGGGTLADMGPTHCTLDDVGLISLLPSFEVAVARNRDTAGVLLQHLLTIDGPSYLRVDGAADDTSGTSEPGEAVQRLREGDDAAVIVMGGVTCNALAAVDELRATGVNTEVLAVLKLRPLDTATLTETLGSKPVLIVEEHVATGGLASALLRQVPRLRCRAVRHLTPRAVNDPSRRGGGDLRLSSSEIRRSVQALIHPDTARP